MAKIKKILNYFLHPLLLLIFTGVTILTLSRTSDFIKDRLSYEMLNYNVPGDKNEYKPLISFSKTPEKIEEDGNKSFTGLFISYSSNGLFISDYRENVVGNNRFIGTDMSLHLMFQPTYSIATSKDDSDQGYKLDYEHYQTYYSDDILGKRGYLQYRFGAESFLFISDSFADKLISYYKQLYSLDELTYDDLILYERYALIYLENDNGNFIKLCINNIIYSNVGKAPRVQELHGDFGLINLGYGIEKKLDSEFEVEIKNNPYTTKRVFSDFSRFGYNIETCDFSFKTYDDQAKKYVTNERLDNLFIQASSNKDNMVYSMLSIILIFLAEIILFILDYKPNNNHVPLAISFLIMTLMIVVGAIVVTYIYNYPLFSICPLLMWIFHYLLRRKEINSGFKKLFAKHKK